VELHFSAAPVSVETTLLISFRELLNEDGFPVKPRNFFDTPSKLRRICIICVMIAANISFIDCYKDQNEGRVECKLLTTKMPDRILAMWNRHTYEVKYDHSFGIILSLHKLQCRLKMCVFLCYSSG